MELLAAARGRTFDRARVSGKGVFGSKPAPGYGGKRPPSPPPERLMSTKVSAPATAESLKPSRGRLPSARQGVTGEGVLECCGVLTSEPGSDGPSWDPITVFS